MSGVLRMRARWLLAGGGALVLGLGLVLLRAEPIIASDQGVFLSVAARMLDGDRLYADVVENKDPLYFYTYAAALWVGGWRGPYLLDAVWLAVAAVSMALLLRALKAPTAAVLAGFFIYPLALVGSWYSAGHTMLAGLVFAPVAAWLWLGKRYALAGAAFGVVMLFKLHVAAVAAAPLVAFIALGAPDGRRRRPLVEGLLGLGATLVSAAALLGIRGELRAYLDTITYNVYYSRALLQSDSFLGRAREHLEVVTGHFEGAGRWQLPAALLVVSGFVVAGAYLVRLRGLTGRLLAATAGVTLALTVLTLVLTAYWFHHNQMLSYPATFMAAVFIAVAASVLGRTAAVVVASLCVAVALVSMVRSEPRVEVSPAWTAEASSASAAALEQARARYFDPAEPVRYMVFGGNSENAHAVFIGDGFELVCRWFHLYPHSTDGQLEETTECSQREDPELILVTLGFYEPPPDAPRWSAFVGSAKELLAAEYERVVTVHPGFEVWKRKGLSDA